RRVAVMESAGFHGDGLAGLVEKPRQAFGPVLVGDVGIPPRKNTRHWSPVRVKDVPLSIDPLPFQSTPARLTRLPNICGGQPAESFRGWLLIGWAPPSRRTIGLGRWVTLTPCLTPPPASDSPLISDRVPASGPFWRYFITPASASPIRMAMIAMTTNNS